MVEYETRGMELAHTTMDEFGLLFLRPVIRHDVYKIVVLADLSWSISCRSFAPIHLIYEDTCCVVGAIVYTWCVDMNPIHMVSVLLESGGKH